ncbi:MAG: hypothetical protein ACI8WB_001089 [Phenylobacterium sp.]|jgi:hypothetical protein
MKFVLQRTRWIKLSSCAMALAVLASTMAVPALAASKSSKANPFSISKIGVAINKVDEMQVADFNGDGSDDILLLGRDKKQKQLQLITLNQGKLIEQQSAVVNLSRDLLGYDIGRVGASETTSLVFLKPGKVVRFDWATQQLHTLVETDSIYRHSRLSTTDINEMDLLHDVNDDGLPDLVIPDFTHSTIFLQQQDGTFQSPQKIELKAKMQVYRNNAAVFSAAELFLADFNFDGRKDLIYRIESQLHVFLQKSGDQKGQFESVAKVSDLTLALPLSDEDFDFSEDQSNLVTHSFYELMDLNNDNILDLITQVTKSEGIFDKTSKYQFYFGQRGPTDKGADDKSVLTHFPVKADSVISSKGMQFELSLEDMDGDKRLDLISPSFELGIGSIVSSLFSSSADLDVMFHSFNDDKGYDSKPNLEKELTVDFDLDSGQEVYPLLKISDFNGDGINDLLLGYGSKRIQLYSGVKGEKLFERRAKKIKMALPKDGGLVVTRDFNHDGRTDLLIRYDKLDGEGLAGEMKLLLAK